MKISNGKTRPPAPEKIVNGSGGASKAGSAGQLERLRDEAAKTGDYSKVLAFKQRMRNNK